MMPGNVEIRQIHCGNRVIEYHLTRKNVKNINLRIKVDGRILVSANSTVPENYIDNIVRQKSEYIVRMLNKNDETRKHSQEIPRKYVSGEGYEVLGKSLRLIVREGLEEKVLSDGVYIYLTVKDMTDFRKKELLMGKWISEYRRKIFKEIIDNAYKIFQKYDVPYPQLKTRYMISKWGTCQPQQKVITLNSKLIEKPKSCIEYVVLHEFAHFIYPNHSKEFYGFITMLMPDWKERKSLLEK